MDGQTTSRQLVSEEWALNSDTIQGCQNEAQGLTLEQLEQSKEFEEYLEERYFSKEPVGDGERLDEVDDSLNLLHLGKVPYTDLKAYFESLTAVDKVSILVFQKLIGSDGQGSDLGNELLEKFSAEVSRDTLRDDEQDGDYLAGVLHGLQLRCNDF